MPARSILLDIVNLQKIEISRDPGQNAILWGTYMISSSQGGFSQLRGPVSVPLTAQQQTIVNTIWDKVVIAANTAEGL